MTAYKGSLVLIKIGNGATPEVFSTIGGLRAAHLALNNQVLDATTVQSGQWRQLLGSAGISALTLSGSGIFTNSAAEEALRGYAFTSSVNNYQFMFANGDMASGPFQVTAYASEGDIEQEETYALTLESAGTVTFSYA